MTNSQYAFKLNVQTLVDSIPLRDKRSLFFWTFTAPEVLEPKEFKRRWKIFYKKLRRTFPDNMFIRVFELHPGEQGDWNGHGLHIHALCHLLIDVHTVRHIANSAGLGRIHVKRIPVGKATNYISKYLDKTKRSRARILKGMRLWETINFQGKNTKVKNILRLTFKSWFLRTIETHRKYLRQVNPQLAQQLSLQVSIQWGYRRFKILSQFFDTYVYELAQSLIGIYNKLRQDYNLSPVYVY